MSATSSSSPRSNEPVEAPVGEVLRAAGEDELATIAGLHQLEQAGLALAAAPVTVAQHLGAFGEGVLEAGEVDVGHRAGALAEDEGGPIVDRRGRCRSPPLDERHLGRLRRQRLDGVGRAVARAGAAAEALLGVVDDGAKDGDPLGHLDLGRGGVARQAPQRGAERATPRPLGGVEELVHVEGRAALAGPGGAVLGAGAAADAEFLVAHDLAADVVSAVEGRAGHAHEDLASAVRQRHALRPP